MLGYLYPHAKDWNIMVLDLLKVPATGIHFESRIREVEKKKVSDQ
jgi:hypothetical protein